MTPRSHYSTHPPWTDMITECITTIPDGTRCGVSRPAIKKFVDSKYHLSMNAAVTGQLNRAIMHGTHSGNFVLPKGPSGKVKLALKERNKEPKHPVATNAKAPASTKTKSALFAEEQGSGSKTMSRTRKYTSKAKRARVTPVHRVHGEGDGCQMALQEARNGSGRVSVDKQ